MSGAQNSRRVVQDALAALGVIAVGEDEWMLPPRRDRRGGEDRPPGWTAAAKEAVRKAEEKRRRRASRRRAEWAARELAEQSRAFERSKLVDVEATREAMARARELTEGVER